jgi:hypothetical protein
MFDHPSYGFTGKQMTGFSVPAGKGGQIINPERLALRTGNPALANSAALRSVGGGVGSAIGSIGLWAAIGALLGGLVGRFVPFVGMTKGAIAGATLLGGWQGVSEWGSGAFGAYGVTDVRFGPGEVPGNVSRLSSDASGHIFAWDQRGQVITDPGIIETATAHAKWLFNSAKGGDPMQAPAPGFTVTPPTGPVTTGWGAGKGVILGVGAAAVVLIISRVVSGRWG